MGGEYSRIWMARDGARTGRALRVPRGAPQHARGHRASCEAVSQV